MPGCVEAERDPVRDQHFGNRPSGQVGCVDDDERGSVGCQIMAIAEQPAAVLDVASRVPDEQRLAGDA